MGGGGGGGGSANLCGVEIKRKIPGRLRYLRILWKTNKQTVEMVESLVWNRGIFSAGGWREKVDRGLGKGEGGHFGERRYCWMGEREGY